MNFSVFNFLSKWFLFACCFIPIIGGVVIIYFPIYEWARIIGVLPILSTFFMIQIWKDLP